MAKEGPRGGQDKSIIIIPRELLDKIDQNRDNFSRVEFIEFCVDSFLRGEEAAIQQGKIAPDESPKAEELVSREEFNEFKKNIKELQKAYIDLLLSFVLEPLSKASAEEQESFKQKVTELLGD